MKSWWNHDEIIMKSSWSFLELHDLLIFMFYFYFRFVFSFTGNSYFYFVSYFLFHFFIFYVSKKTRNAISWNLAVVRPRHLCSRPISCKSSWFSKCWEYIFIYFCPNIWKIFGISFFGNYTGHPFGNDTGHSLGII